MKFLPEPARGRPELHQSLRETRAQLRSLFDYHPDGVFSLDIEAGSWP